MARQTYSRNKVIQYLSQHPKDTDIDQMYTTLAEVLEEVKEGRVKADYVLHIAKASEVQALAKTLKVYSYILLHSIVNHYEKLRINTLTPCLISSYTSSISYENEEDNPIPVLTRALLDENIQEYSIVSCDEITVNPSISIKQMQEIWDEKFNAIVTQMNQTISEFTQAFTKKDNEDEEQHAVEVVEKIIIFSRLLDRFTRSYIELIDDTISEDLDVLDAFVRSEFGDFKNCISLLPYNDLEKFKSILKTNTNNYCASFINFLAFLGKDNRWIEHFSLFIRAELQIKKLSYKEELLQEWELSLKKYFRKTIIDSLESTMTALYNTN